MTKKLTINEVKNQIDIGVEQSKPLGSCMDLVAQGAKVLDFGLQGIIDFGFSKEPVLEYEMSDQTFELTCKGYDKFLEFQKPLTFGQELICRKFINWVYEQEYKTHDPKDGDAQAYNEYLDSIDSKDQRVTQAELDKEKDNFFMNTIVRGESEVIKDIVDSEGTLENQLKYCKKINDEYLSKIIQKYLLEKQR